MCVCVCVCVCVRKKKSFKIIQKLTNILLLSCQFCPGTFEIHYDNLQFSQIWR